MYSYPRPVCHPPADSPLQNPIPSSLKDDCTRRPCGSGMSAMPLLCGPRFRSSCLAFSSCIFSGLPLPPSPKEELEAGNNLHILVAVARFPSPSVSFLVHGTLIDGSMYADSPLRFPPHRRSYCRFSLSSRRLQLRPGGKASVPKALTDVLPSRISGKQ